MVNPGFHVDVLLKSVAVFGNVSYETKNKLKFQDLFSSYKTYFRSNNVVPISQNTFALELRDYFWFLGQIHLVRYSRNKALYICPRCAF